MGSNVDRSFYARSTQCFGENGRERGAGEISTISRLRKPCLLSGCPGAHKLLWFYGQALMMDGVDGWWLDL
jgi:hypothetical protein